MRWWWMEEGTYMPGGAVRRAPENQPLDGRRVDGAPRDLALRLHGRRRSRSRSKANPLSLSAIVAGQLLFMTHQEELYVVRLYLDKQ